jgi:Tol biopolymer transport system component
VAPGAGAQVEPSWSPDGTRIIFSENGELMLDEPSEPNPARQLTPSQTGVLDTDPSFAPTLKSNTIAFIQSTNTASQLCLATISKQTPLSTPSCASSPGWTLEGQVSWSPDGSTIVVLGAQNGGATFGLIAFTSKVPFSTKASDWGSGTVETDTSHADQGVLAGAISPNGKHMALVSNVGTSSFYLYVVPAGDFKPTPTQQLPVLACQVAWRSDSKVLAVVQANGACGPNATGTLVAVKPAHPHNVTILATQAAHPAWQPIPSSG